MVNQVSNNPVRVALVTGATGAIGAAIAEGIASNLNYEVVLLARDESKARRVVTDISGVSGNTKVRFELADLSRQSEVAALVERWSGPLHVLVNNAAVSPRRRQVTPEGIECQFATNVLGYFWMIRAFADRLSHSTHARVVNVASYWAGDLDLDDLEFRKRDYNNHKAYRQSKQANRMLTVAFADRLKLFDISVNACHPGDVNSKLSNNLGFGGHESPAEGAQTPVWLATSDMGYSQTGKYFENLREVRCTFGENRQMVEALFHICEKY